MAKSEDRIRQVETTKKKHGKDFYSRIAKKGGENSPTKFDSKTGSAAIKARWAKYRAEQAKREKEGEQS